MPTASSADGMVKGFRPEPDVRGVRHSVSRDVQWSKGFVLQVEYFHWLWAGHVRAVWTGVPGGWGKRCIHLAWWFTSRMASYGVVCWSAAPRSGIGLGCC